MPSELILIRAIQKPLLRVEWINQRLVMFAVITGGAAQHQVFVVMPAASAKFAIKMINLIVGWNAKIVWVETIRAFLVEVLKQEG